MISLDDVKADLRVRHDEDDVLILRLLDAAVDECLRFMNRRELPVIPDDPESGSSESESECESDGVVDPWQGTGTMPPSIRAAVFLLVQAGYDRMKPDEVELRRRRAEVLCMPYRWDMGV